MHFLLVGGVVTKKACYRMFLTFFLTPCLVTTPPTGFLRKKKKDILEIIFFYFFDVYTLSLKVWKIGGEIFFSKLTTFSSVFTTYALCSVTNVNI